MTLHRRQELFLDGMEVSADMALIAYERLRSTLELDSQRSMNGDKPEQASIVAMLLDAWAMVDSVYRVRTLVQKAPLFKKKSPGCVAFLKDTQNVDALRHFAQHMGEKTLKVADSGYPIWGSISWCYATPEGMAKGQFACMIRIPGRLAKSKGHPIVNPLGHEVSLPVGMVSLTAGGTTINLSLVYEAVVRFRGRLNRAVVRAQREREESDQAEQPLQLELEA